jgi:hypothetical protein
MKSIFQLDKQGDLAGLSYQPGQAGPQQAPKPTFFESLAAAEHHLANVLSCDVQRVLDGPVGRIYKSHLGTFALIEHPLNVHPESVKSESAVESDQAPVAVEPTKAE